MAISVFGGVGGMIAQERGPRPPGSSALMSRSRRRGNGHERDQIFDAADVLLHKVGFLPTAQLAGKTAGTLNARRDNAVVVSDLIASIRRLEDVGDDGVVGDAVAIPVAAGGV